METERRRELEKVYSETDYVVVSDASEIVIRIGEQNRQLEELLATRDADSWAFLTAYNPFSQTLSDSENVIRQASLFDLLRNAGYRFLSGRGENKDEQWPAEPSVLVLGIEKPEAIEVGRRFDQNALLFGTRGSSPELVWCTDG